MAENVPHEMPSADRVVVRVADAGDLDELVPLFDAYREFYGAVADPQSTRDFLAARTARGESVLFVARHAPSAPHDGVAAVTAAGTIVGFAQLYPFFSSVSLRRVAVLNDLFVLPEWRRSSVARRLIARTTAFAADGGAIRLELATQFTNTPARQLYDSLGFVPDFEFTHLSLALLASAHVGAPASERGE